MPRYRKLTRESTVEHAIVQHANREGILTFKFVSPGHAGVPDRIFVYGGVTAYLEIKRPGEKPRPLQEHVARALRNHGAICEWVDNVEAGKAFLDRLKSQGCSCYHLL